MCGENPHPALTAADACGSSPRVRGKPGNTGSDTVGTGLIPACAGKTTGVIPKAVASWAHPRVCGENDLYAYRVALDGGSSPRVRGKLYPIRMEGTNNGLIPACAGKTARKVSEETKSPAHPRVCGENACGCAPSMVPLGSSPRVRGKLQHAPGCFNLHGLIPACAGKTPPVDNPVENPGAHPRVCGENKPGMIHAGVTKGSSPRVRGKPFHMDAGGIIDRLIPACAGKTLRA